MPPADNRQNYFHLSGSYTALPLGAVVQIELYSYKHKVLAHNIAFQPPIFGFSKPRCAVTCPK